ncbi:biotin carboxylase N-terminal domain-containing protein [Euzebya sp.]|uniref:ATP-binding protein n=1 Tax=Euzebya sp. TaxID=1971409 RepID=UPI00351151E7
MITRLLIANRGEIACRIARTARAMGIEVVAVHGRPDADAAHVAAADVAVPLDGTTAAETYLDIDALLAAARTAGADAVHPGYGFLAENAAFARAVIDAGLTWVGPSPEAIAAMGDKLAAKRIMADAGVPTLPSTTDPADAADIGFPVIVKAAAGGGGKGMRVVTDPADLDEAVAAARREAAGAFGDDTVFVERYLERPRHIEVQVLADTHGRVVHLGERECSIQRRHQKVIEEAPSPVVDAAARERLGRAAVAAAEAIGYVGAGTVEFVAVEAADGLEFSFLEVNTRLQVEHPVTEAVWRVGDDPAPLDLVRLQLLVADGAPLPFDQADLHLDGWAVEARLYAEDPAAGFLPATGTVELLAPANLPSTRWDSGVRTGDVISPHFDPMIAKVIAHGPTRTEAVRLAATELARTRLHGVTTNRDALVAVLRHPAFVAGDLHTGFLDAHLTPEALAPAPSPEAVTAHVAAAALAGLHRRRRAARVPRHVPAGGRHNPADPQRTACRHRGSEIAATHRPTGGEGWAVAVDDVTHPVVLHGIAGDDAVVVELTVDGRRLRCAVDRVDGGPGEEAIWLVDSPLGATRLVEVPRFPTAVAAAVEGGLVAPMPGAVIAVHVGEGDEVVEGQPLVVLEAMKMEHRITAPEPGTVAEVGVAVGDQVEAGAVLVVIEAG